MGYCDHPGRFSFPCPFFHLDDPRCQEERPPDDLALPAALLVLRVLDDFFLVAPSGLGQYPLLHQTASWLNFVLPIGMGGMWMTVYCGCFPAGNSWSSGRFTSRDRNLKLSDARTSSLGSPVMPGGTSVAYSEGEGVGAESLKRGYEVSGVNVQALGIFLIFFIVTAALVFTC